MIGSTSAVVQTLNEIADELAGIREALEQLVRAVLLPIASTAEPQRVHQALGRCWCGESHPIHEAIRLNAEIEIIAEEEPSHEPA